MEEATFYDLTFLFAPKKTIEAHPLSVDDLQVPSESAEHTFLDAGNGQSIYMLSEAEFLLS